MATTGNANSISIFALLEALRRRKLFVIIPTLIIAAGFGIYAYLQPTSYRATTSLAVAQTAPPESLKQRLEAEGKQLETYKGQIAHALPDHIDDNLREAERLRATYQDRTLKIAEEEARRTSIQKQLQDLEAKGILDQPNVFEKTAA